MILGTGIDLSSIGRIKAALERSGDAFLRRVFTAAERQYALAHREPERPLAARFAAKEAAIKALGGWAPTMSWQDMEILRAAEGPPVLLLHGGARARADAMGVRAIHVSLTHEADMAAAMVVLED